MSGHSKWSTIKRKKGVTDAKRGKIFTRCIHEITVAVKEGGSDIDGNPRLRLAVDKAKSQNMPGGNIDRAIKRASGELKGGEMHELMYEGFGPGGCALMVQAVTDNKNRTAGEVRFAFTKSGGSLGEGGSVAWMFDKKGVVLISTPEEVTEEQVMEVAIDAGAEDVSFEEGIWEVTSEVSDFNNVRQALEAEFKIEEAEIQMVPTTKMALSGEDAKKMERLMELLDDIDDVLNVFSNCEFELGD